MPLPTPAIIRRETGRKERLLTQLKESVNDQHDGDDIWCDAPSATRQARARRGRGWVRDRARPRLVRSLLAANIRGLIEELGAKSALMQREVVPGGVSECYLSCATMAARVGGLDRQLEGRPNGGEHPRIAAIRRSEGLRPELGAYPSL